MNSVEIKLCICEKSKIAPSRRAESWQHFPNINFSPAHRIQLQLLTLLKISIWIIVLVSRKSQSLRLLLIHTKQNYTSKQKKTHTNQTKNLKHNEKPRWRPVPTDATKWRRLSRKTSDKKLLSREGSFFVREFETTGKFSRAVFQYVAFMAWKTGAAIFWSGRWKMSSVTWSMWGECRWRCFIRMCRF